jgi:hypothetical protein
VRQRTRWLLCAALAVAGPAAAVKVGDKVYVKSSGVSAWDKADGKGKKTALKAGDEVSWQGPDDKHKEMQLINFGPGGKKKGYVNIAVLSPNKPADEISGDGKTTSAQAFASSGAASKALTSAGLKYAEGGGEKAVLAAAEIIHLEGSSEDEKKNVADHVKKAGLGGGEK